MEFNHISVLLEECLKGLEIKQDGIYLDGTLGGAGHSLEICKKLGTGTLIGLDKDPDALTVARKRLEGYPCAEVISSDFSELSFVLDQLQIQGVDGILLDIGVSSHQLDSPERGFSYRQDAKLDMRMSQSGLSAYDVVNEYSLADLTRVLRVYGEEKFAYSIAKKIVKSREMNPIETTLALVDVIKSGLPAAVKRKEKNPAKQSFQALRIEVNKEFERLEKAIEEGFERLNPKGRLAIITFHSLEDRIVKQKFLELCKGCICPPKFPVCVCHQTPKGKLVNKKPIIATPEELEKNKRSKSAKLRIIEKI